MHKEERRIMTNREEQFKISILKLYVVVSIHENQKQDIKIVVNTNKYLDNTDNFCIPLIK